MLDTQRSEKSVGILILFEPGTKTLNWVKKKNLNARQFPNCYPVRKIVKEIQTSVYFDHNQKPLNNNNKILYQ